MSKAWAHVLAIGLILAIVAPIHKQLRGSRGDSFPLSWYPMFSRPRPALQPVTYMLGITASGDRHVVHTKHSVRGAMNRARRQLTRLAHKPRTAQTLCDKVAARFAKRRRGTMSEVVQIWLVQGKFDLDSYFADQHKAPVSERIKWACQVPGRTVFRVPDRGEIYHFETAQ